MCRRNVQRGVTCGLVLQSANVNELHAFFDDELRERFGVRGVVIKAGRSQGNEGLDLTAGNSGLKFGKAAHLRSRAVLQQFDGRTVSAEGVIDRSNERVDFRAIAGTGKNDRLAFVVDQIANGWGNPLLEAGRGRVSECFGGGISEFRSDESCCNWDQTGRERLAMIGHAASQRVAVFKNVETVHVRRLGFLCTMLGEGRDRFACNWINTQEVAVQREDTHRGAELHEGLNACTEHFLVRCGLAFAACSFVLKELHLWVSGLQFTKKAKIGRRGRGTRDDSKTGT